MRSDSAAVLAHNAIAEAQAQTGSLADFLGREERIENLLHVFGRDARAVVLENDAHAALGKFRGDAQPAFFLSAFHRLSRVIDDVQEDLLHLMGVYFG